MRVEGTEELMRTLRRIGEAAYDEAAGALMERGEEIMTRSKMVTPVEFGTLRGSGKVDTDRGSRTTTVTLGFGGPAIPYALYVHEGDPAWNWSAAGTGPKYLERPFRDGTQNIERWLAKRIERRVEHVAR